MARSWRLTLDPFGLLRLRPGLAVAGAALIIAAAAPAAAAASTPPIPSIGAVPSTGTGGGVAGGVVGGAQLGGKGVVVNQGAKLPGIKASAWVIADAGTGQVLAAKDPHGWYRPASTLKMLTAVSLIPALNPGASVVASKQAASATPNIVGLLQGHSYQVSALFTALLTISANDAAIALATATGSYADGMAVVNAEAKHLQADDTVAVDPNGLDAKGQHTSAYDLALVARQALTLPAFLQYDRTTSYKFRVSKKKVVNLWNQNSLLTTYKGAIGGKIGWTNAAGATYVGMAKRNGRTLIVTLLHCPALTEIKSAAKLLNWGFANDGKVKPVGTLVSAVTAAPGSVTAAASASASASAGAAGAAGAAGSSPGAPGQSPAAATSRDKSRSVASGPSVMAAAGFSGVALIAAVIGFEWTRRQRVSARYPRRHAGGPGDA